MRPDPRQRLTGDDTGRIIQLGEVRRKRASRRQAPDRHYLWAVAIAGVIGWALWLSVLFSLQPQKLLTYLAFSIPLGIALWSTATIVAYGVDWRRGVMPDLGRCARRGLLIAALLIANVAFRAGHHWSVLFLLGSIVLAILIDLVLSRAN